MLASCESQVEDYPIVSSLGARGGDKVSAERLFVNLQIDGSSMRGEQSGGVENHPQHSMGLSSSIR
jgi:hypothetical protein